MTHARSTPSLDDPADAEAHFRVLIDRGHLASNTALLVGCDAQARPASHWHLLDCPDAPTPSECSAVIDGLLSEVDDGPPVTGLALGLTRPGGEEVQPYDRIWFRAFHRVCHQRGLTPYGVYTITRTGARTLHIDDAA